MEIKSRGILTNVVILMSIVKIIFFYYLIDFSKNSILYVLITIVYISTVALLLMAKNSRKIFIYLYSFITLIMFLDCVYYSYFNQLPSLNQLFQMNNLIVVDESIKFALPPISIFLFSDIPFIYKALSKIKIDFTKERYNKIGKVSNIIVLSTTVLLTFMVINPFNMNAVKLVNHNEFVSYHLFDLYTILFGYKDNNVNSNSDVEQVMNLLTKQDHSKKKLNGIAKDRNLIIIQVESLQDFVIDAFYNNQELTPNLNQLLKKDTIYFNNFYQTIGKGNTADAEFSIQNSLYPVISGASYKLYEGNTFYGLPWIMRENGYQTIAFHGYKGDFWNREKAYVNQGFQEFISLEDFNLIEEIGFGLSDTEMFNQTMDYLKSLKEPFYSFVITLTNHHPYIMPNEYITMELDEADKDTIFGNYIQSVQYTDNALGAFINRLKEEGLYDNSIIAIYGDHYGLNCKDKEIYESMKRYLNYEYNYKEMLNIPLLIHIPGSNIKRRIETVGGQVDFLPTIANLLGVKVNNKYILGQDLINAKDGFVASLTYMIRGSFITDEYFFEMSKDAIFEKSKAFEMRTGKQAEISGLKEYHKKALKLIDTSEYILENDLIKNIK